MTQESQGVQQPSAPASQPEQTAPSQEQVPAQGGNQEGCLNDAMFN